MGAVSAARGADGQGDVLATQAQQKVQEVGMIALVATATFAILDIYAPSVGASARTGAGFGIGAGLVGFPGAGLKM
jgi:hypothetical protein